jgi:hypothetical protein
MKIWCRHIFEDEELTDAGKSWIMKENSLRIPLRVYICENKMTVSGHRHYSLLPNSYFAYLCRTGHCKLPLTLHTSHEK